MKPLMRLAMLLVLVCASTATPADEEILFLRRVVWEKDAVVDEDLKKCDPENLVIATAFQHVKRRYADASLIDAPVNSSQPYVRLRISWLRTMPGLDVKLLNLSADIVQEDDVVRTRGYRLRTTLEASPENGGVCGLIERMANQLGVQLAAWVPAALRVMAAKREARSPSEVEKDD